VNISGSDDDAEAIELSTGTGVHMIVRHSRDHC
jgi:hypothetical protein